MFKFILIQIKGQSRDLSIARHMVFFTDTFMLKVLWMNNVR
jgi:hypothetical protein